MKRTVNSTASEATDRKALRRRVKQFCGRFNKEDWDGCYALVDPRLTQEGKAELGTYSKLMQAFKDVYGSVKPRWIRLGLHMQGAPKQGDSRPFAYVCVLWQDAANGFHMFRERWVKENGRWYTRVVGLVPNRQGSDSRRDTGLPEPENGGNFGQTPRFLDL